MIIDEIIELRKKSGIDFGESYVDLLRIYKELMRWGYLEYIYEDGELKGFIDWMRLKEIPSHRDFTWMDTPGIGRGDYVYISTIAVKGRKYFWALIKKLRKKEHNKAKWVCYHNKKGILKVYKNSKGGNNE